MSLKASVAVKALSCCVLGAAALGAMDAGSPSAPSPGPGEFHAPRIPGPAPAVHPGALSVVQGWTSHNWSGYSLVRTGVTGVTGNWKVPRVLTPTKKRQLRSNRFSSSWVGVDGFNNSSLIQAGTEQDWFQGTAFYQAWWEILPAPETPITSMAVHPGDSISVSITRGAANQWTISLSDTTTHQSFTTVRTYTGPRTSAEWIQEAPTLGQRVAALAADSNVIFDLGTVSGANPALTASDAGSMYKGRVRISTPSAPNPARNGFAVAYGSVAPPAPSS
jgi:hypothetical protein